MQQYVSINATYSIDPVTAGPIKDDPSTLEDMSAEEKEREAEKLEGLLKKLDKSVVITMLPHSVEMLISTMKISAIAYCRHGIIKVMPLDQHNQPLRFTGEPDSDSDEAD